MIKNFFKIAYRNLLRSKGFSIINITGLAIGMAAAILIILWIQSEVNFDDFHTNKDRIYRVWNQVKQEGQIRSWDSTSEPTGAAAKKDIPEVELAVKARNCGDLLLTNGDKKIQKLGLLADTGFFQMFTFPMLKGNALTALTDKASIVLTESTAKALFGDVDPIGKVVNVELSFNLKVTGVIKDVPTQSRFSFDYVIPWEAGKDPTKVDYGWNDNSIPTYIMLKPKASFAAANLKIKELKQHYSNDAKNDKWELFLYPMERWHLYSSFTDGIEDGNGRSGFVRLFSIIAGFILLIACINFMNLSTARSEKRAKEVGIRKVVGAQKGSLIFQFIGESVFLVFLAGIVAVLIVVVSLPAYNQLVGKKLFINFTDAYTWVAFIGFVLFTGLLAGSYPAFFLSAFQPIKVLKGTFKQAHAFFNPRKALVVIQFSFAITLIICTIIVKQQIDHAQSRQTGYNKDNLVYHFMTGDIHKNFAVIKNELLQAGIATSITRTNSPMTAKWSDGPGQNWKGKDPNAKYIFDRFMADDGLITTTGLQLIQGRDFNLGKFPTDSTGLIVNESSLKLMKFKNPIGQVVNDLGIDWHIIGVVKDFIMTNPFEPTRPILITGAKGGFLSFNVIQMKFNAGTPMSANLKKAGAIFSRYNPQYPVDFKFVDESYAEKFDNEQLQGTLAALFAGLTIFISCLGLFGLASYTAENRIKEIGVRKVLGASVARITTLLSKDLITLVIISFIVAAPIAYWAMNKWLMTYSYRVTISWWVFALAGVLSVTIALLTVSYQSVKAALANPVKSLRTE
jgi:putative ABC transport system permease protein